MKEECKHTVFAIPPGEEEARPLIDFSRPQYQLAEKYATYLRKKGYAEVRVVTSYPKEGYDEH